MKLFYSFLIGLSIAFSASANVTMPGIFGNNMVLQRNKSIPVWGWAKANETIVVTLNDQKKTVKADRNGNWMIKLSPEKAGGPYALKIKGNKSTITFSEVLIGEVWVCSGQSNMEWPLSSANNAAQEIADANYPEIRHFTVEKAVSNSPQKDIKGGNWEMANPKTAGKFSAVAYFFARKLYQELKVPIGVINTSWGGTHVETWTSREAFRNSEEFKSMIASVPTMNLESVTKIKTDKFEKDFKMWRNEILPESLLSEWYKPSFDDSNWKSLNAPQLWESQGLDGVDGVLLFRKSFSVDAVNAGRPAVIELAKIDDNDVTYINGIKVGSTQGYDIPRKYNIPAGILKAGINEIAVRIEDALGGGGFYNGTMQITYGIQVQSLAGQWRYKFENINPSTSSATVNPNDYPSLLYNAMLHPLIPYAIQGAIWYQGESNANRAWQYQKAFPLMITDWRKQWKQGDFPFYFVQLASFNAGGSFDKNLGYEWAELREAQTLTLSLPNTGMAVTSDIGEVNDIHPRNKQDVGIRLAMTALRNTYKKDIIGSGPMFQSMKTEGNKIVIAFSNTGTGLLVKDKYGYLKGFEIAGADKTYHYAKAYIQGDKVIVSSDDVASPIAVRFGWFDDISENNLFSKEGFPAVPFRTDNWPRITVSEKFKAQ